ncbi:MAG: hypothetical protein AVDCRST_MAG09-2228 [uncultured Sphingomonas sp.]|uniref:Uncharacterized protein n=1 Tax=uncultured Sphingomonas sp. TaxID=158754 RepID=A0A6J4TI16_9SPHN|nr:hypothetical protein [uncultured Sphingomonas sp.]CAA9523798.1 MAG: hypothetical protein AVDCRST_MAG09-2228 [uncultured Sphingomonas sp.]
MPEGGHTSLVERIARVLCGAEHSANAEGSKTSAGEHVNQHWPKHRNQALAVLHAIRETDQAGAGAGDPVLWQRMVDASIASENSKA